MVVGTSGLASKQSGRQKQARAAGSGLPQGWVDRCTQQTVYQG